MAKLKIFQQYFPAIPTLPALTRQQYPHQTKKRKVPDAPLTTAAAKTVEDMEALLPWNLYAPGLTGEMISRIG